jgi:hypothetical protein
MEVNLMPILGLLLLLAAAGLAVDVVLQNTSSVSMDAVGQSFSLSVGWLFVAGVATGVIGLLGASLLVAGAARARRRRAALAESQSTLEGLQAERDRLAVELERERFGRTSMAAGPWQHGDHDVHNDQSAVIDLYAEAEPASDDYATVPSAAGREPAVGTDVPVESGRSGLFHRRH